MKYAIGAILGIIFFAWMFSVCSPAGKNKTGHEYMPDMSHPVGYEANVYSAYSYNHWDDESTFPKAQLSQPRLPVEGTVARGATAVYYGDASALNVIRGKNAPNAIAAQPNGHAPFDYLNTDADRIRCEKEMGLNPFPIVNADLDAAKPLYEIYCGVCHGKDGKGAPVMTEKYLAAPKNLVGDDMIAAGNGRFYFAIMHGRNVMGSYADKLSFDERWKVIHYIRSLQAKEKKLKYDETANTLSNIEKPAKGEATGPARVFVAPAAAPAAGN